MSRYINAEQIKSELQGCINLFDGRATDFTAMCKALALINSQEQRIKELTEENERWQDLVKEVQEYNEAWVKDNHDLRAENERLVRANSAINNAVLAVDRMAKSDTVRKMCQQIKEHFPYDADSGLYVVLDQIAKEMLEGENEN